MKKLHTIFLMAMMLSMMVFSSCETDVDIYTDGDETTIVYGYLDVDADTNFLKITKSFVGNALELAPDYSASNYDYKLDVQLKGKFADSPNTVSIAVFDTVSVYKPYDPNTIFYSGRNQVLYYTTRKLKENEEYQLTVKRNDGVELTSKVKTISGSSIKKPYNNISFESPVTNRIEWRPNTVGELAAYYEVIGYFHYKQFLQNGTDTTRHTMKWVMGSGTGEQLWSSADKWLSINYTPNDFYKRLQADDNIVNNSPDFVRRIVEGFEVVVTSTGEELYNYILIQNSGSAIQDTPEYTNIENGMGILSSRSVCRKMVTVNDITINTLERDYPQWGFFRVY